MMNFLKIDNFDGTLREHILELRSRRDLMKQLSNAPDLLNICKEYDINFSKLIEVGPSWPAAVAAKDIIDRNPQYGEVILIEARPDVCQALTQTYQHLENVKIINCAISRQKGVITMYDYNHSTFIEGLQSPYAVNQGSVGSPPSKPNRGTGNKFEIKSNTFDYFDDGDIDILLMDVEGAEFFVIEKMISRPDLIVCETHSLIPHMPDKEYINPFIEEISLWMKENDYGLYQICYSDSVFIKNTVLEK